ncbi:MAG: PAS domain S-box protein [Vicinamibacterales bacterium]
MIPANSGPPSSDLDVERVRAHVDVVPMALLGVVVIAAFLAGMLLHVVAPARLLAWLALLAVPVAGRLLAARAYRRDPSAHAPRQWLWRLRAGAIAQAAVWGVAGVWLFPPLDVPHQAFLAFAVGGVAAAAVTVTAFDLAAGLWFLGIALLPLVGRLLLAAGDVQTTMAAALGMFLAYVAVNAGRAQRQWLDGVAARWDASARADELRALNASLERQVAERTGRLLENEARFRAVFDESPTIVALLSLRDLRLIEVNAAWEAAFGIARADAVGRTSAELGLWVDPGSRQRTLDELAERGAVGGVEAELQRADGSRFWGLIHSRTLTIGDEPCSLSTVVDISERKQALLDLAESEARFRAVFDKGPIVMSLIRLADDRFVEVNDAALAMFGYDRSEVIGRTALELGLWLDLAQREATVAALRRDGRLRGAEVHFRRKSGEPFWAEFSSSVITLGGEPYALGTLVDVTARKRAQQDLADSEARFHAVFDHSPIGMSLVRLADRQTVEVNDAALAALGYDRADVIGRTSPELRLWVHQTDYDAAVATMRETGRIDAVEVPLRRKDGSHFWASFSSSRFSLQGEPYALSAYQDITERRQLEARFLQSQKMEVLGHLAGGVAHDFNNVLTVIRSTAELALDSTAEGTPLHEALATIRDTSARASGLTSQLLAFSRRQILQPVVLDLNHLVDDLAPMLRRAIGERITLDLRPADGPATILADRSSIEQVVLNLAINARDAMQAGGTLTITVAMAAATPRQVVLTITDTGVGMNDATLARLFEPFFTTKETGKGTGLGLSTAHGIVTQSGGEIAVTSAPGAGTTFTVRLPWVAPAPPLPVVPRADVAGGHETILVVDDDADIRDVVRRALSSAGYRVLLSSSGDEALELLGRHPGAVQLLLTDVVMPGISGQDLATRVRRQHPAVRILYSSGFVDDAVEANGGLADVPFIAKPYSLKALTRKVRDVLDA